MLDPVLLQAFVAVADCGGFTRAAMVLNRTQSAVSMQIKRLEELVGFAVFVRQGKQIHLSGEGEALIGYARRLLSLNDEAMQAVSPKRHEGPVRFGCIDAYAARVLPHILATFARLNPNVQILVKTGSSSYLLEHLRTDYDLVLAMQPAGTCRGEVLRREPAVWVHSRRDAATKMTPIPLALRPEGCLLRRMATMALDQAGRAWRCAYLSPNVAAVEAAVEEGLAVSVFNLGSLSPRLQPLSKELGFPPLGEIEIALHLAPGGLPKSAPELAEHICDSLRQWSRCAPAA